MQSTSIQDFPPRHLESQDQYQQLKQLLQNKQYEELRQLLQTQRDLQKQKIRAALRLSPVYKHPFFTPNAGQDPHNSGQRCLHDHMIDITMRNTVLNPIKDSDYTMQGPPFSPGIAANLLYKVVELATYTSAFATDVINTLNVGHSTRRNYSYDDEILQIDDDDESICDHNKKDVSIWGENVENVEEESEPGQSY